jgi:thiamine transport system substrate-binding protein
MYPAIDLGDELPDVFDRLIEPTKALIFSPETLRNNRQAWINEWLDTMTR